MRGYKGMTKDMTCREMKFEIGKTYHVDGEISLCKNGLHFCERLIDVLDFYSNSNGNRYFEIKADGEIKTDLPDDLIFYECSECGCIQCFYKQSIHIKHFCPHCGMKMIEPQEGSDKD